MSAPEKSRTSESSSVTGAAQLSSSKSPRSNRDGQLPQAAALKGDRQIQGDDGKVQEERSASNPEASSVLTLQICKQPPEAVFLDEGFEVQFLLMAKKGRHPAADSAFTISASLVEIEQAARSSVRRISIYRLIVMERPAPLQIGVPGMIRCSITANVGRDDHLFTSTFRTRLCANAVVEDGSSSSKPVATTLSSEVAVVRYKILVSPSVDWSNIWYKDEGGRDKCMEVVAGVYDNHRALLYENVPLLLTLCYASKRDAPPVQVTNQEILRVLGPKMNKLKIDESTGNVKIRFRIEDVSKNHQGQDFCVKISAAEAGKSRVAPGLTPPITIRSKRNKRRISSSTAPADAPSVDAQGRRYSTVPWSSVDGQDTLRFKEAVRGVVQWADDVITSLYPLMWQVVGFAQDADGNPDYSRPYHNMVNPNGTISRVLSIYNESTREHLNHLQRAIGQQPSPAASESLSREMTDYASRSMARDQLYKMMPSGYPPANPRGPSAFGTGRLAGLQHNLAQQPVLFAQQHQVDVGKTAKVGRGSLNTNPAYSHPAANVTVGPVGKIHERASASTHTGAPLEHNGDDTLTADKETPAPASRPQSREKGVEASPPTVTFNRESEVEYLLAKQFKSLRTGERLGFPAYSSSKELLGFYQEPCKFIPICRLSTDFGSVEKRQATEILEQAMSAFSDSVHSMKQWDSITNMLNHALVYEWSKGLATTKDDAKATNQIGD